MFNTCLHNLFYKKTVKSTMHISFYNSKNDFHQQTPKIWGKLVKNIYIWVSTEIWNETFMNLFFKQKLYDCISCIQGKNISVDCFAVPSSGLYWLQINPICARVSPMSPMTSSINNSSVTVYLAWLSMEDFNELLIDKSNINRQIS